MTRVRIDFCDGSYSMMSIPEGEEREGDIMINDIVWRAYCAHLEQDAVYQQFIRMLEVTHSGEE